MRWNCPCPSRYIHQYRRGMAVGSIEIHPTELDELMADVMARGDIGTARTTAPSRIRPFLPPRPRRVFGRGNDHRALCPRSPIHPEFARHTRLVERIRVYSIGPYFRSARSCREGRIRILCNPI